MFENYRRALLRIRSSADERRAAVPKSTIACSATRGTAAVTFLDSLPDTDAFAAKGPPEAGAVLVAIDHSNATTNRTISASCHVSGSGEVTNAPPPPYVATGDARRSVPFDAFVRGDFDAWLSGAGEL